MAYYYLDIETEGIDPDKDKILTIQYQPLNSGGYPKDKLVILKEWESSEEEIVKKFYKILITDCNSCWDFIPIMQNHIFDLNFLIKKFKKYNLKVDEDLKFLFKIPLIDIRYTLIIANGMAFKGCGLDKMTKKERDGSIIPLWYKEKKYKEIESYIIQEAESFIEALQIIINNLKDLKSKLKKE
jgi:hypothetical protein